MTTTRVLVSALIGGCLLPPSPAHAADGMRITLRFTPKENVTKNIPVLDRASPARLIEVLPLKDDRALADPTLVGENRERGNPRPVRATSSVAVFATLVLKKCLSDWGVRVESGGLVLRGEITDLFVTEENTYSTQVSIRFRLEDQAGKLAWEGITAGDAHQWGRSMSAENYNEQISDALKRTYARLLSNPTFQKAWGGEDGRPKVVALAELKATILRMMSEGIGTDVILSYLRGLEIAPGLSPDQIIDWKRAGITEEVLKAAVSK